MLANLIALDFKMYRAKLKWALPVYGLLLLSALVFRALNIPFLGGFAFGLAAFATVLVVPATLVLAIAHYYQHFYTNQGYLTHTLPVTPGDRFTAKLISGFCLYAAGTLATLAGAVTLTLAEGLANGNGFSQVGQLFADIGRFPLVFGLGAPLGWLLIVVGWLGIYLLCFAAYSFSISAGMGRRLSRFGIGGPIVAYIGYYLVNQVVGLASFLFIPLSLRIRPAADGVKTSLEAVMPYFSMVGHGTFNDSASPDEVLRQVGHIDFGLGIVLFLLVLMAASFIVTKRLLQRVNLR